ncbi:UPF0577 protein KIAA1324-like protein, partial [Leptotrombidium deliense]
FQYSFTECDEFGGRWRVSVPLKPHNCTGGAPNAPIRVDACFTSCNPGSFFNRTSLICQPCEAGTYSLGGGVKYTSFNASTLNALGFRTNKESPHQTDECPEWTVKNSMITYVGNDNPTEGCVSVLTYTVKIVKKGKLKFTYQYLLPDGYSSVLFTFQYRNYEEVGSEGYNIKFPPLTREQQWRPIEITIRKTGLYVFTWKSVLMSRISNPKYSMQKFFAKREAVTNPLRTESALIRIKSIELDGVAYASECTRCEPGTYASEKEQSYCKICPKDTYSDVSGAVECKKCEPSQYSKPGSKSCSKRPFCTENDFYESYGECDEHSRKQKVYKKFIEPRVCIATDQSDKYESRSCDPEVINKQCSPGMELKNNTCSFCPENYYKNSSMENCERCIASTLPDYALILDTWLYPIAESPLIRLSSECVLENGLNTDSGCDEDTISWQTTPATKSYIRSSSLAVLNSYLLLTLAVDGFRSSEGGDVLFSFEIECMEGDSCHFIFMETIGRSYMSQMTNVIQEWTGDSGGPKMFQYKIEQNTSLTLSWVFRRTIHIQSHAKIYEIKLTNALGTGAIRCNPCPHGEESTCVPCPKGQYMGTEIKHIHTGGTHTHAKEKKCMNCPPNTIINEKTNFAVGAESCIPCGSGLKSNSNHSACYSDCHINLNGEIYDLSRIPQPLFMKGSHLFTSGGTQYFHFFNITLCGLHGSSCVTNISSPVMENVGTDTVDSMICRTTVVPDSNEVFSTQPVSLGAINFITTILGATNSV